MSVRIGASGASVAAREGRETFLRYIDTLEEIGWDSVWFSDRIVGPGLAGIAARAAGRKPSLSADEYLRESIVEPSAFVVDDYDNLMPAGFARLEGDDLNSLINYLKTLQ